MRFVCFSLVCLFSILPTSVGSSCADITGRWLNQQGAEVEIDHVTAGRLQGKFFAAGNVIGHDLVGELPYNKPGSSFAFSVTKDNGSSTTVWTGQCQVCDGKEILETSWLSRSYVHSCIDRWGSTLIGKDIFNRKTGQVRKQEAAKKPVKNIQEPVPFSKCDIRGVWYNDLGSEVILNQTKDGIIIGEYRTAVERQKGSAGSTHSLVYGSGIFGDPNSTFSMMVIWRGGKSATGFVGQCHICGENRTTILETNWLLRSQIDNCIDAWKSTLYGVNTFTRHEQKPGPRKSEGTHTPNRDGEDDDTGSGSSSSPLVSLSLIFFLVYVGWVMM